MEVDAGREFATEDELRLAGKLGGARGPALVKEPPLRGKFGRRKELTAIPELALGFWSVEQLPVEGKLSGVKFLAPKESTLRDGSGRRRELKVFPGVTLGLCPV